MINQFVKNVLYISALAGLLIGGSVVAADQEIEKQFTAELGQTLEVDTDVGSIRVDGYDGQDVTVRVIIDGLDEEEFKVDISQTSTGIKISGDKTVSSWGWNSVSARFEVRVPIEFNVNLRTNGGSISVSNLNGTVNSKTSGGSLDFDRIVGPINGRTSGGSISVTKVTGDVDVKTSGGSLNLGDIDGELYARTSGGSIDLGRVAGLANVATSGGSVEIENAGGSVIAKTSGGSVRVTFSQQPQGDSELSTSGGSITAYLTEGIAVQLDARARMVYSDFPVDGATEAKYKLRGPINGGGPERELKTSSGNVYIRKN